MRDSASAEVRRLEAAEVVRTPAGCPPRRGCGVFLGGVEADGDAVRLDVYCAGAPPLVVVPPEVPGPSAA